MGAALPASAPALRMRHAADEDSSLATPPGSVPPPLPAATITPVLPSKGMLLLSARKELSILAAAPGTRNAAAEKAAPTLPGMAPPPSSAKKELLADGRAAAAGADKETPDLRVTN